MKEKVETKCQTILGWIPGNPGLRPSEKEGCVQGCVQGGFPGDTTGKERTRQDRAEGKLPMWSQRRPQLFLQGIRN